MNGEVNSVAVQADGRLVLGGGFTSVNGSVVSPTTGVNRIARLNADGTLDTAFNASGGTGLGGANGFVRSVAVQSDGKLVLVGDFTSVNGTGPHYWLARLNNAAATQSLMVPDTTQVLWSRSGAGPELSTVTFEQSTDGETNWTSLGVGTRIGSTANWILTGLTLPSTVSVRARGRTVSGSMNGSSGLIELVSSFTGLITPPPTVTHNSANLFSNATTITITGTNFDSVTPGNNTVVFTPAGNGTVTASTATSLTVASLSGLTLGALNAVVTTNVLNSGAAVQVATVIPPPPLPMVTLNTANIFSNATTITITGANFDAATPSNNTVVFSPAGTGIVTASTATSLTVISLSGLMTGPLTAAVTTNGQTSASAVQVATVVAAVPEIAVTGNSVYIPHGNTTSSTSDFTDFGTVALLNAQVSHAFDITNTGILALHLTGTPLVTINGPGAAAFEVTLDPANKVAAADNTTFAITFDPSLPGPHTAFVTISSDAVNHPSFTFAISGYGALSKLRTQAITFAPPTTAYVGQSPLSLSAHASSGLPVSLSVVPVGTTSVGANIAGNTLNFTGAGTVKVQAAQVGGGNYAAAPTVVKTITVRTTPTVLTLLNLAQHYTGTPRTISTIGGSGAVTVEYKIGAAFGSSAPTNVGSYPVRATDRKGTKTGTLVIAKSPLYVIPVDQRKFVGQDNPPLTLKYSGWLNGDSASVVTTAPALKTTATNTSVGGVYAITASGGVVSPNYSFIYQQGALVVDSFAGSYEALLTDGSSDLVGKLAISVTAANTSCTGKLHCADEKTAMPLNVGLVFNPVTSSVTGSTTVISSGIPYFVSITAMIDGSLIASVTRDGTAYASPSTGRRLLTLAAGKKAPYSGAHTVVLEPATPAASTVPAGAGWATAAISTKGVMTLMGRLGDGTSFTTSLTPDDASDPTYRLFQQPYRTGAATRLHSYLGGAFTLLPRPALAGRRYVESAALTWVKAGLMTDATYSAGFTRVSTLLMLDPWLPPATGFPLATRLGLTNSSFQVLHSDTGSPLNGNLPTRVRLSAANAVTVIANTTKWKTTLVPATGLFTGSFELADTTPKPRVVNFSGVLRQPATAPDTLIGDGHYLLPPLTGTEKITGEIMFLRP